MKFMWSVDSPVVAGTLWVLILLSVVTWSIALYKLWRQMKDGKRNRVFQQTFWSAQDWAGAESVARQGEGDLAYLAVAGFDEIREIASGRGDLMHQGNPQEVLERQMRQQVQNLQRHHEQGQAELATIGSTAPFVGLFGTVWGIMHALKTIGESGSASLDVVAGPIGEALIATAIGIATALPAVLAYNYFLRRLRVRVSEMDNFAHDFLRLAARQGRGD
jgi:biopolymer transport protein ExbB